MERGVIYRIHTSYLSFDHYYGKPNIIAMQSAVLLQVAPTQATGKPAELEQEVQLVNI